MSLVLVLILAYFPPPIPAPMVPMIGVPFDPPDRIYEAPVECDDVTTLRRPDIKVKALWTCEPGAYGENAISI